jgi:hypothetical protein
MKNIRALVALFLLAVFITGVAWANTSSIDPTVPAQNSPLSSSVLRGNFGNAANDVNTLFGIDSLSSSQILGTIQAGNAGPLNLPSCATGALSWTPGSGFGCNSLSGLVSPVTQNLVFTGGHIINFNATTAPTKQTGTVVQVVDADTVTTRVELDSFAAPSHFSGVRADGTNAAPTTLQSGDEIASFNAFGYNGSATVGPKAAFRTYAAQNWTGLANGTRADIAAALNGSTTMSPVIGFENDGGVTIPPTVTGGDCGAGCVNATHLEVSGVAVLTGPTPVLGVNGTTSGAIGLANSTTGGATATIQNPSATAAYNFNLPSTAGTSGQALLSGGGGSAPMTWGTAGALVEIGGPQTASNSATLQWTNLPTTYNTLLLSCSGLIVATNATNLGVQVGESTGPTWETSSYIFTDVLSAGGSSSSSGSTTNCTSTEDSGDTSRVSFNCGTNDMINGSAQPTIANYTINNISSSSLYKVIHGTNEYWSGSNIINAGTASGVYTGDTNPITAIRVIAAAGNISSGTCSLYGLVP